MYIFFHYVIVLSIKPKHTKKSSVQELKIKREFSYHIMLKTYSMGVYFNLTKYSTVMQDLCVCVLDV